MRMISICGSVIVILKYCACQFDAVDRGHAKRGDQELERTKTSCGCERAAGVERGGDEISLVPERVADVEVIVTQNEVDLGLEVTFDQLALIYKSLQAVKTLGALPPQDELLNDTLDVVDQALKRAVHPVLGFERPAA